MSLNGIVEFDETSQQGVTLDCVLLEDINLQGLGSAYVCSSESNSTSLLLSQQFRLSSTLLHQQVSLSGAMFSQQVYLLRALCL